MSRPFAWLHVQTRLPEDWEMMLYSLDPTFGELRFFTRAGFRASLEWKPEKIPRALRGQKGWCWEWSGSEPEEEGEASAGRRMASTLDVERKLRLTWTFPEETASVGEEVVAATCAQGEETHRMTMFGIRAVFPAEFTPETVQVHPANHMLCLKAEGPRRRVYRRWGLPEQVLGDDPVDSFFRKLLKAEGLRVEGTESDRVGEWEAVRIDFTSKGLTPWRRMCFRRDIGRGWIWLDEGAKRLCTLELLGEPEGYFPKPEACLDVENA